MGKNILIFSDGTGYTGGFMPDETRSNVYKLFRATRVCPDTRIDPRQQVAFYDSGLGSGADAGNMPVGWRRWIYNALSQATGLGITQNIIDCYAAIIRVWQPGDRIYLFGFSRGAYTARCVSGVLRLCGVPTRMQDGSPLKRDLKSVRRIATEAVKRVYQHGSSIKGDPCKAQREARGRRFRACYASGDREEANAAPYLVGVWDTVATLGAGWRGLALLGGLYAVCIAVAAFALRLVSSSWLCTSRLPPWACDWPFLHCVVLFGIELPILLYLLASLRRGEPISLARYRMAFYGTTLDHAVPFARHALSIDENRRAFKQVVWDEEKLASATAPMQTPAPERFKQVWFAGNHTDVGGGYPEAESRLSDITLAWMVEEATGLPEPILVDRSVLNLYPDCAGLQHDEREEFIAGRPDWLVELALRFVKRSRLGWVEGHRRIARDAPLHASVLERFALPCVLIYGDTGPYRPHALRNHLDVRHYYVGHPPAENPQAIRHPGRARNRSKVLDRASSA